MRSNAIIDIINGIVRKYERSYISLIEWVGGYDKIDLPTINAMTFILYHELSTEPTIDIKFKLNWTVLTLTDVLDVRIFPKLTIMVDPSELKSSSKREERDISQLADLTIDPFTQFRNIDYATEDSPFRVKSYDVISNKSSIAAEKKRLKDRFRITSFSKMNKVKISRIRSSCFILDRYVTLLKI
jgi:hypothetical protein